MKTIKDIFNEPINKDMLKRIRELNGDPHLYCYLMGQWQRMINDEAIRNNLKPPFTIHD